MTVITPILLDLNALSIFRLVLSQHYKSPRASFSRNWGALLSMVRATGLEPARSYPIDPKSIAATNYAMPALLIGRSLVTPNKRLSFRKARLFYSESQPCPLIFLRRLQGKVIKDRLAGSKVVI